MFHLALLLFKLSALPEKNKKKKNKTTVEFTT